MFSEEHQQRVREFDVEDPEPILPSIEEPAHQPTPLASPPTPQEPQLHFTDAAEPSSALAVIVCTNPINLEEPPDNHPATCAAQLSEVQLRLQVQETADSPSEIAPPFEEQLDYIKKSCNNLENLMKGIKYEQLEGKLQFNFFKERVMKYIFNIEKDIAATQVSVSGFRANYINSQTEVILSQSSLSTTVHDQSASIQALDAKVDNLSAQIAELFSFVKDGGAKKRERTDLESEP
ncbi:uncharacterized protein [Henckelia pumila]|uniref:uncharacterized protein n=1 Tax=Henckelia pumila TaxID=405737 RepID=UPI003C6E38B2